MKSEIREKLLELHEAVYKREFESHPARLFVRDVAATLDEMGPDATIFGLARDQAFRTIVAAVPVLELFVEFRKDRERFNEEQGRKLIERFVAMKGMQVKRVIAARDDEPPPPPPTFVTPPLLEWLEARGLDDAVFVVKERDFYGKGKHGEGLSFPSFFPHITFAKQELGDLLQYAFSVKMQGKDLSELADGVRALVEMLTEAGVELDLDLEAGFAQ